MKHRVLSRAHKRGDYIDLAIRPDFLLKTNLKSKLSQFLLFGSVRKCAVQ